MLKKARTSKKIPLSFVATKIGVSRDRLTRIEDGYSDLPTKAIPVLSELYGINELEIIRLHVEDIRIAKR